MASPPMSPTYGHQPRPMSAMLRGQPPRSASRMSTGSRTGGSRASDEEGGKTSVKVAVRVRPPLRPEDPGYELIPQRFQRSMAHVTSPTSVCVDSPQGRKVFVFDRVFSEEVQQDGIWEYLADSVNSFIQGYNVSLLAYGQSGAGKSYTMGTAGPGETSNPKSTGIIPRAARALFEQLGEGSAKTSGRPMSVSGLRQPSRFSTQAGPSSKAAQEKNWVMKATYVEIYNETLRDLLVPEHERGDSSSVTIREDKTGRILLTGLNQVEINSFEDLMNCLNFGSTIRQTDATAVNAKSSRSHAVFTLNLVQKKPKPNSREDRRLSMPLDMMAGDAGLVTVDSKFHFVDLAGSERLKNTGAQGDRAKEGISINAGLAALGKVISQLSSRNTGSHVSYRDSKLTRLLQDSLGGNAITYMIACVNPVEFYLSETLNTIQYAQRARAIQSKPRIQQVSDDGDLRAMVDRLKAEIAFLREQLRNANTTDSGERARKDSKESTARSSEKEKELQNQLMDLQENYNALTQRHSKLISEMAKVRGDSEPISSNYETVGDAAERLQRSSNFAEQVQSVLLEYEETIRSLELELNRTRTSLSNTESSLLEKETKLAYSETMNHQLQTRLQKLMDREASTESYLHDLENKLDGHTSGEEKNAAIIAELRKEIARIRENEASAEDYISTLEERLAEADQDMELMQREIDRLEHVVDRQRSLGKLDNLLHELGSLDKKAETAKPSKEKEGVREEGIDSSRPPSESGYVTEEIREDDATSEATRSRKKSPQALLDSTTPTEKIEHPPPSPAQAEFVNDKYHVLQQELLELRVEHEQTVNEFESLSHSYENVLRELETLRDQLDEFRHAKPGLTPRTSSPPASPMPRPTSFLADARVSELKGIEGQPSSSRSLSSELSLAVESHTYSEPNGLGIHLPETNGEDISEQMREQEEQDEEVKEEKVLELKDDILSEALAKLKAEQEEKERLIRELEEEKARLADENERTLLMVQELQSDVARAKQQSAGVPVTQRHSLRRKSSQSLIVLDRAIRSFDGIKSLVLPLLEGEPDLLAKFDENMDGALHELQTRSDRIQELEKDVEILKIEIDKKNTLISGLTRERGRSKEAASPVDISVLAALEQKIAETVHELDQTREKLAEQEAALTKEINELKVKLETSINEAQQTVQQLLDTKAQLSEQLSLNEEHTKRIAALEGDLTETESRHQATIDSLRESIRALEAAAVSVQSSREAAAKDAAEKQSAFGEIEQERFAQQGLIDELQKTIAEQQSVVTSHLSRIAELEKQIFASQEEVAKQQDTDSAHSDETLKQISFQQQRLAELEALLADSTSSADKQKSELDTLRTSYENALQQLSELTAREAMALQAVQEAEKKAAAELEALSRKYEEGLTTSQVELEESRATIAAQVERLEKLEATTLEANTLIQKLEQEKALAEAEASKNRDLANQLEKEMADTQATILKHQDTIGELQELHKMMQTEIDRLAKKEQSRSQVIEELETQLAYTFDQNQDSQKKLAELTAELEQVRQERSVLVEESKGKVQESNRLQESLNEEINSLKAKLAETQAELNAINSGRAQRSNSTSSNSNLRKTASTVSLPSPPPQVPLPPLPNAAQGPSSPTSSQVAGGSRRPSKDYVAAHMEDQEARIKTLEKQLIAEKALTQTLEEALTECEKSMNRLTADRDSLQAKAAQVQAELERTKNESQSSRYSMQAVEDERLARIKAEQAKEQLELRMQALAKKQKRSFACF